MNAPILFKSYAAALADPPWEFDNYSDAGKAKAPEYQTMSTPAIIALREELQLDFVFAPDAILTLWGTWPMMARGDVHAVMLGWGFTPITGGSWFKITRTGKDTFGTGYIFRDNCEPYLVGTRGDPGLPAVRNIRNGFRAMRPPAHSEKPTYLHRALERMYPRGPFLEMFAREPRKNWDGWGKDYGRKPEPKQRRKREPKPARPIEPPPEPGSLLATMKQQNVPMESA